MADDWEWQRLGDSTAFGETLLEILEAHGWTIERRPLFAGAGVLVMATRADVDRSICGEGSTVSDAGLALFTEIASQPSLLRPAA